MFRKRIIPILLFKNDSIVKTRLFKDEVYLGDPLNAVQIFNHRKVDELIFLDIKASKENRCIEAQLVNEISSECLMPLAVGGGIRNINQVSQLLSNGAEKVIINSFAYNNYNFIESLSKEFGSQAVVGAIDYLDSELYSFSGSKSEKINKMQHINQLIDSGVGEIFLQNMGKEGCQNGLDFFTIKEVSAQIKVPLIASGGAGKIEDVFEILNNTECSAVACGSLFSLHGKYRSALISYPDREILNHFFEKTENANM